MSLTEDSLRLVVRELSGRPKHEKVRTLIYKLLVDELGTPSDDITFERNTEIAEVRGRMDALLGLTIFEFKSNLSLELKAVELKMPQYLRDREAITGQRYVGVATDGLDFIAYRLSEGTLEELTRFRVIRNNPRSLVEWLALTISADARLQPKPETVRNELGKDSLAYAVARSDLRAMWGRLSNDSEAQLKRQLWASLLEKVYGTNVDADDLFFQHTYLTIIAKAMATQVLGIPMPNALDLLSGKPLIDAGIFGAVESDFFDWLLHDEGGEQLVTRLCIQAQRFDLEHVKEDVLKNLYESLIDPEQRHDLGEYYTPDWLAEMVQRKAVRAPLSERVLDPSCGSGTFLFHSVRRVLSEAEAENLSLDDALALVTRLIIGIDIHPVAVIIARVVYLLALGERRLYSRQRELSIPVFLGDSLQWNTEALLSATSVRIDVPDGPSLYFPSSITSNPTIFDSIVEAMLKFGNTSADSAAFQTWLHSNHAVVDEPDVEILLETYDKLQALQQQRRNHIWNYVARNLARPIWLSSNSERADVIIGNPPWLSYRYMSKFMQDQFKTESKRLGIWGGGVGRVSHQDLSGYFLARCVECYGKPGSRIAFILPYAALGRKHFRKLLVGRYGEKVRASARTGSVAKERLHAEVKFTEIWAFSERVSPVFLVPSCVLFGESSPAGPLPGSMTDYEGRLPRRDCTLGEARAALSSRLAPLPDAGDATSYYAPQFRNGAIIYPRVFFFVDRVDSRLGSTSVAPVFQSRRSKLEKKPWSELKEIHGPIEQRFVRHLLIGDSVAPFRLLSPVLAVVPWDDQQRKLLDAAAAQAAGAVNLSSWLRKVQAAWIALSKKGESIVDRLDTFGQLSAQMPISRLRVVYTKSGGKNLAATIAVDCDALIENRLYWAAPSTLDEALYLVAILNSEWLHEVINSRRSRGLWGGRDFDKVVLEMPIPQFASDVPNHMLLRDLAMKAQAIACAVLFVGTESAGQMRAAIKAALRASSIPSEIDEAVKRLLSSVDEEI